MSKDDKTKSKAVKRIRVRAIKQEHVDMPWNGTDITYREIATYLYLRIGKHRTTFSYKNRSRTEKIGNYPFVSLLQARQKYLEINIEQRGIASTPDEYKPKKTLLEAIYGDPTLYQQQKYHTNEFIRDNVLEGSYLHYYKDRKNKSAFIDKKNKMRALASHFTDLDGKCVKRINRINGNQLKKIAEAHHLVKGHTALSAKRLFAEWKTFFKFLSIEEDNYVSPLAGIELGRKIKVTRPAFNDPTWSPDNVRNLVKTWTADQENEDYLMQKPYKWLIPLMMFTGRRMNSVIRLKKSDIDLERGLINFNPDNEKAWMNSSEQVPPAYIEVPMSNYLKRIIKDEILPYKPEEDYLLPHPSIPGIEMKVQDRQMRDRVREITGIKNFKYKDIRTNVNTALIQMGIDMRVRQLLLCQKAEKVQNSSLQKAVTLSVNEKYYDPTSYLKEKTDAVNKLEKYWSIESDNEAELDGDWHPNYNDQIEMLNKWLKYNNREEVTELHENIYLNMMYAQNSIGKFIKFQRFEDYRLIQKYDTPDTRDFAYAFFIKDLQGEPNQEIIKIIRDSHHHLDSLKFQVSGMDESDFKRKYDPKAIEIIADIIDSDSGIKWMKKDKDHLIELLFEGSVEKYDENLKYRLDNKRDLFNKFCECFDTDNHDTLVGYQSKYKNYHLSEKILEDLKGNLLVDEDAFAYDKYNFPS